MSYKSATIKSLIADIDQSKVFLPALQRKFVWNRHQIELLFDSLMRNYPIGSFLFWRLQSSKAASYVFYEFLKEYDERDPFNRRRTGGFTHGEITGILDGQQRLSSIYIALMGTHTEKEPYKRRSNQAAYEKTKLHLNVLSLPYTVSADDEVVELDDRNFEFRFLSEVAARTNARATKPESGGATYQEPMLWVDVGMVMSWGSDPDFDRIVERLPEKCDTSLQREALLANRRYVRKCFSLLHKRICQEQLINYFEVAKDDLEDILKIFVRVNSGGTILSKADLLFSTIVATWDDGREKIEGLLKSINGKGDKFYFTNEFLMRCCLVLSDAAVVYHVQSFKPENVQRIRDEWANIAKAIEKTVELLVEFGFSGELLTSQNATLVLAYYVYKGGACDPDSKQALRRYLVHALLNRIFTSSQDQVIGALRNGLRTEVPAEGGRISYIGRFTKLSFEDLCAIELPAQRSLVVGEADLERFLNFTKGADAFLVLTFLYPQLRYSETVFHQDHLHPYSGFSEAGLAKLGIPRTEWSEWLGRRDSVANLQLLEGRKNSSKSDTALEDWVNKMTPREQDKFSLDNYIPSDVPHGFSNFIKFTEARKHLLREALKKVLTVAPDASADEDIEAEWVERVDDGEV